MIKVHDWKLISVLVCLLTILSIAGCGGGGGSSAPTPTPTPTPTPAPTPTPEPPPAPSNINGFWGGSQGTASTSAIILANGDSWIVFQESGVATRFARLQTTVSGASFSSSGNQYFLQSGVTEAATANGSFVQQTSITATSGSSALNLAYNSQYDTPASISDAVGSWKGSYGSGGSTLDMNIVANGVLTGTSTTGCSYSGSLQTRSADPAVFDLNLAETCLVGTPRSLSGIATVNAAKTSIFFAVTTADRTLGALFAGTR